MAERGLPQRGGHPQQGEARRQQTVEGALRLFSGPPPPPLQLPLRLQLVSVFVSDDVLPL